MITMQLPGNRIVPISHPVIKNREFRGDRLVKVRLYGRLALVAGREIFNLAVSSVREAISALHVLTEQRTTRYIDETNDRVRWRVLVNGKQIDGDKPSVADELMIERDGIETIDIYPVMEGAANILGLILGAVLLVVGIVLFAVGGWSLYAFGGLALELTLAGAAGVLGGLIGLFQKPQSTPKQTKSKTSNPSYLFSGTVNTQDQGGPVPVAYGNVIVGSQCISAIVTNSDLYETGVGSYNDYQVPMPFAARDTALREAVRAIRGNPKNIQLAAVSTPWNDLGALTFWGYVAKVTVIPYEFNVPTAQQPQVYDNGVYWLFRADNGGLFASYAAGGNVGPWDCLQAFPQELEQIAVTQNQDNYTGWAPTRNIP